MVGTAAPQYIRDKEERYGNEEDANESPIRPAQWSAGGRRGPGGRVLDESDLSGNFTDEYVYFGSMRIAHRTVSSNAIYYYAADALGSSRSIASTTSTPCFDADYYPFGGEHDYTSSCTSNYKFTGQERDTESNSANDYFGARYYANSLGRFLSPDWSKNPSPVPFGDFADPQTLNLFNYTRDNPLNRTDPTGHCDIDGESHGILWCLGHALGITETWKEHSTRIEDDRQWLTQNVALNSAQVEYLKDASGSTINKLYNQWTDALENARCGGTFGWCEEQNILGAKYYRRAADGSYVPLTRLHSDQTITENNSAGYEYWKSKSTEEIIESLKPGSQQPLTVRPDGTILDGNTRTKVLEERGIDINKLERVTIEKIPLEPL